MAEHAGLSLRRPRRLWGLFEEAWQRQRRRRVRIALVCLSVLIAAAVLVRMDLSRGDPTPSRSVTLMQLSSTGLPAAGNLTSLAHVGGRLILAGGPGGWPLDAPGAVTRLAHGRAIGRCSATTIVPGTVRVGRLVHANCGDPALYGLHVLPIMFLEPHLVRGLTMIGVRVAVVDPGARDGYRLGPTVMSYPECSDCGAQWILGDHALWINGPLAGGEHHPGEVLRVSTTTGRVLQRVVVPQLLRALLAVDQDGLWVAPSIETGLPAGQASRRAQHEYTSLYLIAPRAARARQVLNVGTLGVSWLAAAGHHVWLQTTPSQRFNRVVTFTGTRPVHVRRGPLRRVGPGSSAELGEGPVPFAASPRLGVDAVVASSVDRQEVVNYNPTTLTEHVLATIADPGAQDEETTAVTDGSQLYFLDPKLTLASGTTPARLYRLRHNR